MQNKDFFSGVLKSQDSRLKRLIHRHHRCRITPIEYSLLSFTDMAFRDTAPLPASDGTAPGSRCLFMVTGKQKLSGDA